MLTERVTDFSQPTKLKCGGLLYIIVYILRHLVLAVTAFALLKDTVKGIWANHT